MTLEILPNLQILQHLGGSSVGDVFTPFMHERQAAGHSVDLVASSPYVSWQQMQQLQQKERRQLQLKDRRRSSGNRGRKDNSNCSRRTSGGDWS